MLKRKIVSAAAALVMAVSMAAAPAGSIYDSSLSASAASYSAADLSQYAARVAELVNEQRAANGLKALKVSSELSAAANVRAAEIQTTFSHTRPNGTSCFTALKEKGISYTYAGENIAYGQRTPEAVMTAWMNSSGHRANILSSKAEYIGIGVAYKNGTYYWTQFFAAGKGMSGEMVSVTVPTQPTDTTAVTAPTAPTVTKPAAQQSTCKSGSCDTSNSCKSGSYYNRLMCILKKLGCKQCG